MDRDDVLNIISAARAKGQRPDLTSANLREADLCKANLRGANLTSANLSWSVLCEADLTSANLSWSVLCEADLSGAVLARANLRGAHLSGAVLARANLRKADLSGAVLARANLRGADLTGADLREADLRGADLSGAHLSGATDVPAYVCAVTSIIPEGDIIGYKRLRDDLICKLLIPAAAKRSNATGRQCRAEYARVLAIYNDQGEEVESGASQYDPNFVYRVGEVVYPHAWDDDRWNECSGGIHFFLTEYEARNY